MSKLIKAITFLLVQLAVAETLAGLNLNLKFPSNKHD